MKARRTAVLAVLAAVLLLAAPGDGAGQQDSLSREFRGPTLESLERQVTLAGAAGLPTRPLVHKALEGRRKGASDVQVLRAVAALRSRLETAAGVLGLDAGEDVLVAAAGALYVGMEAATLEVMASNTHEDALGMALVVVGDLVRRGVPVGEAGRAVLSLGRAGADADALSDFRRRVDEDITTGLTPGRATELRMRGVLTRLGGPGGGP